MRPRNDETRPLLTWLSIGLAIAAVWLAAGLVVLVAIALGGMPCHGPEERAATDIQAVRSAAELYLAQDPERRCPSIKDLTADRILSSGARTEDPWGRRFEIRCVGDDIKVRSAGPDGSFKTSDDITS